MLVYLKLVASMIIWGGTWVSGRIVAHGMGPFSAAFLRFLFASIFLVLMTMRVERRYPRLKKEAFWPAVLLALTGIFGYNVCFFSGLQTVEAGRASLIIAAIPAFIALLSRFLFKERLGLARAAGIPISLFGVSLVLTGGDYTHALSGGLGLGELFIFGCIFCWAAYSLIGKKAMGSMTPLAAVTWSCLIGDVLLFFPALGEGLVAQVSGASPVVWANLVFLGVMATGLAFCWYYEGIQALGASRAGIFINLVPVAAIVLGVLILGESVSVTLLAGGALVIGGVWLTNRPA